jgi:Flp pilus assembly protein TadD
MAAKLQMQSRSFIFSPVRDLSLVLLTPVFILITFAIARFGGWLDGLIAFGLALAVGHYLPGILRAYADRELRRRFPLRLIAAPLVFGTAAGWFAYHDLQTVVLLQMLWGAWHWAMQVYGFARIYDARASVGARTPPLLDRMLCVSWFGMLLLSRDPLPYVSTFYASGGPLLTSASVALFSRAWLVLTSAITVLFVVNIVRAMRRGQRANPLKIVFLAVTFIYLSYTTSLIAQPLAAFVMFESWHDIQYLALVWFFNVNRTRSAQGAGPVIQFLFRPRLILVISYVGFCLAFGMLNHAYRLFENVVAIRIVVSIVTAAALLHYYLDGFIWRIREPETGMALGVGSPTAGKSNKPSTSAAFHLPVWAGHLVLWMLFIVPVALFVPVTSRTASPLVLNENLVATLPESARAHYEFGRVLLDAGRFSEGRVHLEKALVLAPGLLPSRIALGQLLADQGDLAAARRRFEEALLQDSRNSEIHNGLAVVLDAQGDSAAARSHLAAAIKLHSHQALYHNNLGRILAKAGELEQARASYERAVQLDPQFAEAHYQLGMTLAKQGEFAAATAYLREAVRIDPSSYTAFNALGGVLLNLGKYDEAREHFERALQINPSYASARANLATMSDRK